MKKIHVLSLALLALFWIASCQSTQSQSIKNVTTAEAEKMIKDNPNLVILDVRTAEEYAEGHLDKSVQMDVTKSDFETEAAKLDKTKTYLVYCRSGKRSATACEMLAKLGFANVSNMQGGYMSWSAEGKKSVK